jgi:hypothetical protein
MINSICVYCGSSHGLRNSYRIAAQSMGEGLARGGKRLIYGGGNVGLMGVVADAALAAGGQVIGVIPRPMVEKELAHHGLTELHVVGSMHERKALMGELSQGFIAMPGGIGTLEEFFEIWTWGQLGIHAKPIGLLNIDGFYDPLVRFFEQLVSERFVKPENRDMVLVGEEPATLLERMDAWQPGFVSKWIKPEET